MDIVNGDDFDMSKGVLNPDMDKELYCAIIDNALQGLAIIQNSEVIFANGILAEITGHAPEELQSLSTDVLMSLVHPEDRNRILEVVVDGISRNLSPLRQEFRIIRQDGATVWVDALANFIEYQGKPAIQVALVDITKRKLMEEELKDSEKKYRLLADNASDVTWKFDLNTHRFTYVSPSIQRLRGYTVEEAMLQSLADVLDQDSLAMIEADIPARLQRFYSGDETSRVQTYVVKQPCKDGSLIYAEVATTLLTNEKGDVTEVQGVSRDISERQRVEDELRQSEQKFRSIVENSDDGISLMDESGNIVEWNPGQEHITGLKRDEVLGRPAWDVSFQLLPEDMKTSDEYEKIKSFVLRLLDKGCIALKGWLEDQEILCPDGTRKNVQNVIFPIKTKNGFKIGTVSRDITVRKTTEKALRIRDSAISSSLNAISMADHAGDLFYVNESWLNMLGYEKEEILGLSILEFTQDHKEADEVVNALFAKGKWEGELIMKRKDDSTFDAHLSANLVRDDVGRPICMVASFLDITERKKAERALQESEKKLRALFNLLPIGVFIVDKDAEIIDVNPAFENFVGLSKEELLQGKHWNRKYFWADGTPVSPPKKDGFGEMPIGTSFLDARPLSNLEMGMEKEDGIIVWCNTNAVPLPFLDWEMVVTVSDITQRRQMEKDLQEREERLRKIFELSPIGIQLFDSDGFLVNSNQVGQKIVGLDDPTTYRRFNLFRDILPNGETQAKLQSGQIVNVGRWVEMKSAEAAKKDSNKAPDRNVCIYIDYLITSLGKAGAPEGYLVLLQDLTERKLAEEALISENERLQIIYDIWRTRVQTSNLRIED